MCTQLRVTRLTRSRLSFALSDGLMAHCCVAVARGLFCSCRAEVGAAMPVCVLNANRPFPSLAFPPSFLPAVPYQQNPYTPGSSSTVIQCYRCGDTCKGEVVRVQSNHFHIRCFTCQGRTGPPEELVTRLPHSPGCSLEGKRLGTDLLGPSGCGHTPGAGRFPQGWVWCRAGGEVTARGWHGVPELAGCEQGWLRPGHCHYP